MAKALIAGEDYETFAHIMAVLEGDKHEVTWVNDGMEACEAAVNELPDLIILDQKLKYYNGLESARRIREDPDVPKVTAIVLVSDADIDVRKLEAAGVDELLDKNISAVELRDVAVRLLGDRASAGQG